MRRDCYIEELQQKLSETFDKLDDATTFSDELSKYIIEKEGKFAYRDKFAYIPIKRPHHLRGQKIPFTN